MVHSNSLAINVLGFTGTAFAVGLSSAIISSPAGFLGGAVFGGISYLVGRPVERIVTKIFNTDQHTASKISQFVGAVTGFLAGTAVAWGISSALGVSLTFGGAVVLTIATIGIAGGVICAVALAILINRANGSRAY